MSSQKISNITKATVNSNNGHYSILQNIKNTKNNSNKRSIS